MLHSVVLILPSFGSSDRNFIFIPVMSAGARVNNVFLTRTFHVYYKLFAACILCNLVVIEKRSHQKIFGWGIECVRQFMELAI
jgi:hypothetical protein